MRLHVTTKTRISKKDDEEDEDDEDNDEEFSRPRIFKIIIVMMSANSRNVTGSR